MKIQLRTKDGWLVQAEPCGNPLPEAGTDQYSFSLHTPHGFTEGEHCDVLNGKGGEVRGFIKKAESAGDCFVIELHAAMPRDFFRA